MGLQFITAGINDVFEWVEIHPDCNMVLPHAPMLAIVPRIRKMGSGKMLSWQVNLMTKATYSRW